MIEIKEYVRQGSLRRKRFTGKLLAFESTETDKSLRWTELELFLITEGPHKDWYLLYRVGQSVVYHRPDTCGYGVKTDWNSVPLDAEPCPVCKPKDPRARGNEACEYEVWLEAPRPKLDWCETVTKIEETLQMVRRDGSTFLSNPAQRLLRSAAVHDSKISDLLDTIEDA